MIDTKKTEKEIRLNELLCYLADFPMLIKYFDIESDKLLDEKIEVLEKVKEGKKIDEIPNFYDIFELLPEGHWD